MATVTIIEVTGMVHRLYQFCEDVQASRKLVRVAGEKLGTMLPLLQVFGSQRAQHGDDALVSRFQRELENLETIVKTAKSMNRVLYIMKASSIHEDIDKCFQQIQLTLGTLSAHQNATMQDQFHAFQVKWDSQQTYMKELYKQERAERKQLLQGDIAANLAAASGGGNENLQDAYNALTREHRELQETMQNSNDSVRQSKLELEQLYIQQVIAALEISTQPPAQPLSHLSAQPPVEEGKEEETESGDPAPPPDWAFCPVYQEIMTDPVVVGAACGHIVSRKALKKWIALNKNTCPHCGMPLRTLSISPCANLRDAIENHMDEHGPPGWRTSLSSASTRRVEDPPTADEMDLESQTPTSQVLPTGPSPKIVAPHPPDCNPDDALQETVEFNKLEVSTCAGLERRKLCCCGGAVLVLAVIVAVVVALMAGGDSSKPAGESSKPALESSTSTPARPTAPNPTLSPITAQTTTQAPTTSSPTTPKPTAFLPASTQQAIAENSASPQARAWSWVKQHPEFETMLDWRKQQLMALATTYYATGGDTVWSTAEQGDWLDSSIGECLWQGGDDFDPDCDGDGKYQNLHVAQSGNGGTDNVFPTEVSLLTRLTHLDLEFNSLNGTIPLEMELLTTLTGLGLYGNQLTGTIPSELGQLTALTYLDLLLNQLTGTIPSELGLLTALIYLILYDNQLTGTIPSELGQLTALTNLDLSSNQLTGTIPSELGQLTALTYLNLGDNQLTGTIPSELGQLTALTRLQLSKNQLTGTIPSELGLLTALKSLILQNNALTGTIPSELGQLTALEGLTLSDNQLTGTIPSELGWLPSASITTFGNNLSN